MSKRIATLGILLVMVVTAIAIVPVSAQDGSGTFPISLDHPAAPFIETNAYAINAGATAEFRKMEGVAVDEANGYMYLAMSEINKAMSDTEGDIQLEENNCGIVYRGVLNDDYNIDALEPIIIGGEYTDGAENECDVNAMANPDGLEVDARGRVWIGEDTGNHVNNVLWVYDPADESLKRFATVPVGAEVTGLRIAPDGTIFFNVQHPSPRAMYPYNRGVVGVVVGINANDDFEEIAVPEGDDQLTVLVPEGATYQMLARVGDPLPGAPMGESFGEIIRADGTTQFFCNDPDGNMYLPTTSDSGEGYLYTNVECRPGGVGKLYIRRGDDGMWEVLEGEMVDFSGVMGTWNNCNASVTPWNTGLTSEEYPSETPDDWALGSSGGAMSDYLGRPANPYDYGYNIELIPSSGVGTTVVKRYAMGRFSQEMAEVMPDGMTAYYGDDGSNRILYRFVADVAGDLSVGTLYAAKINQQDGGVLGIEWLELGYGDDFEIYDAIRALDVHFAE